MRIVLLGRDWCMSLCMGGDVLMCWESFKPTHARPSFPVNQNLNPAPAAQYKLATHQICYTLYCCWYNISSFLWSNSSIEFLPFKYQINFQEESKLRNSDCYCNHATWDCSKSFIESGSTYQVNSMKSFVLKIWLTFNKSIQSNFLCVIIAIMVGKFELVQ